MTAAELRGWLARRGISAYRLAKLLGRPPRTVQAWAAGARPVPPELPLALNSLESRQQTPRRG